jgi:hypothetical protein
LAEVDATRANAPAAQAKVLAVINLEVGYPARRGNEFSDVAPSVLNGATHGRMRKR